MEVRRDNRRNNGDGNVRENDRHDCNGSVSRAADLPNAGRAMIIRTCVDMFVVMYYADDERHGGISQTDQSYD